MIFLLVSYVLGWLLLMICLWCWLLWFEVFNIDDVVVVICQVQFDVDVDEVVVLVCVVDGVLGRVLCYVGFDIVGFDDVIVGIVVDGDCDNVWWLWLVKVLGVKIVQLCYEVFFDCVLVFIVCVVWIWFGGQLKIVFDVYVVVCDLVGVVVGLLFDVQVMVFEMVGIVVLLWM